MVRHMKIKHDNLADYGLLAACAAFVVLPWAYQQAGYSDQPHIMEKHSYHVGKLVPIVTTPNEAQCKKLAKTVGVQGSYYLKCRQLKHPKTHNGN